MNAVVALEAMNIWLMELGNEGRSPRTIQAYEAELVDTFRCIGDSHGVLLHEVRVNKVSRDDLIMSVAQFRTRPDPRFTRHPEQGPIERSPARVARRIAAIKVFFKWCYATGRIESDPAALLRTPRKTRRLPKALEAETAFSVMHGASESRWPERDLMIIVLALTTGMRLEEMATLKVRDLVGTPPTAINVVGKGNKERSLPLPSVAREALAAYLPSREAKLKKFGLQAKTVFISTRPRGAGADANGEPVLTVEATKAGVAYVVDKVLRRAGARRPGARVHVLRHTFATLGLRPDAATGRPAYNLRQLQTALGHANLATIQVYTEVSDAELVTAAQSHPLAR